MYLSEVEKQQTVVYHDMVGSLRSAICLLAADVETKGGQGGGPRRAVRPPFDT